MILQDIAFGSFESLCTIGMHSGCKIGMFDMLSNPVGSKTEWRCSRVVFCHGHDLQKIVIMHMVFLTCLRHLQVCEDSCTESFEFLQRRTLPQHCGGPTACMMDLMLLQ